MSNTRTFTIIKPDAHKAAHTGAILNDILQAGFRLVAIKQIRLSKELATHFYAVHQHRDFFQELVRFMCEGPIVVAVLEKPNAVQEFRNLLGATNPKQAEAHSLRAKYGTTVESNAVHGSDSDANAEREISFFFASAELI